MRLDATSLAPLWSINFASLDNLALVSCTDYHLTTYSTNYQTGSIIRLWDIATGDEWIPDAPIYGSPFSDLSSDWLSLNRDDSLLVPTECFQCRAVNLIQVQAGEIALTLTLPPKMFYSAIRFSANHLITKVWGENYQKFILIYGIPSEAQPAHVAVPGYVLPSDINLRAEPSLEAEVIGFVENGYVLVSARDEAGQFLYLENVPAKESGNVDVVTLSGWVNASRSYVDIGSIMIEDLPIKR